MCPYRSICWFWVLKTHEVNVQPKCGNLKKKKGEARFDVKFGAELVWISRDCLFLYPQVNACPFEL